LNPNEAFILSLFARNAVGNYNFLEMRRLASSAVDMAPKDYELILNLICVERWLGGPLHLDTHVEEKIATCHKFLEVCPVDHPERPSVLYLMAWIDRANQANWVEKAREAEIQQLEAFLPHLSIDKQLVLSRMGDAKIVCVLESSVSANFCVSKRKDKRMGNEQAVFWPKGLCCDRSARRCDAVTKT
jgi:hypothetical protein